MRNVRLLSAALAVCLGLARVATAVPESTGPAPADPKPPVLRLGDAVSPTRYVVDLAIDPSKTSFHGSVTIDLALAAPTSFVWLNATDLTVSSATLEAGGKSFAARVVPGNEDTVGFALPEAAPAGPARLVARYTGAIREKETAGLFRQREGDDFYVFSQFEAIDARRAFPCLDEPSWKVPFTLALTVPKAAGAYANTPSVSTTENADGTKTVRFAETKPLPTYLLAFGVGPFEEVEAGRWGKSKTAVRMIVPKGRTGDTRWAVASTGPILEVLEDYFGIAYPYEKLDNLVIPQTVQFGAMENPGLVTYASSVLLAKPSEETIGFKRNYASVAAHEMAHQWFGDLVTMKFWDDIWLNEGFATWMASKVMERWKPEWDAPVGRVVSRSGALGEDTLVSARKVRQEIDSKDDIANAFDGITYQKGAALLGMFEEWTGEERFRLGVQRYMKKHAFGNATSKDFLDAIAAEADGEAKKTLAAAFSTFLDQPGAPLVTAELVTEAGAAPKLELSQRRFVPLGSPGAAKQLWHVPVCVRWGAGDAVGRACTLLTGETGELTLGTAPAKPDWVLANASAIGYYRVAYAGDLLTKLFANGARPLTLAEKVGSLGDASALSQTGDLPIAKALSLVPLFASSSNRHLVASTIRIAAAVDEHLVADGLRPNYVRFVQKTYGDRARAAGFASRPGDGEDEKILRVQLLGLVGDQGEDAGLRAEASRLAKAWLADRKAVEPDVVSTVLSLAALHGEPSLFEALAAEAKKTSNRRERSQLLAALGKFREPSTAEKARGLVLSDAFDARQAISIVWNQSGERTTRAGVWDFVRKNFDALESKLPKDYPANLPYAASGFCDAGHRAEVTAFFGDRAKKYAGGPRTLAQVAEEIGICEAFQKAQAGSVAEFLKAYPPVPTAKAL